MLCMYIKGNMNYYNNKHLAFPFDIDADGRTRQVSSLENHIRDEIIQLLIRKHIAEVKFCKYLNSTQGNVATAS